MREQDSFFLVAERTENDTTYYKVPNELRDMLKVFKANEITLVTATLPEFRKVAVMWFENYPAGLELLQRIKPWMVINKEGWHLCGFEVLLTNN